MDTMLLGWDAHRRTAPRRDGVIARIAAAGVAWRRRVQMRRYLAALDDCLLADTGLTRDDRAVECSKPFWKP